MRADKHDTTWLFEGGRSLFFIFEHHREAKFFARKIKEKIGTKTTRAKALKREVAKNDSNHVPTSVDAYIVATLKEWFEDKDIATGLLLSLNKHRLTILCILGSNLTDFKKLGFRDEDALKKAHKSITIKGRQG
jgi:hypothetical protein